MKIVESIEESGLLIKRISEIKQTNKNSDFFKCCKEH